MMGAEKGRFGEDGKMRGLAIVSFYTNSQKHSWLNRQIAALETEFDSQTQKVRGLEKDS